MLFKNDRSFWPFVGRAEQSRAEHEHRKPKEIGTNEVAIPRQFGESEQRENEQTNGPEGVEQGEKSWKKLLA